MELDVRALIRHDGSCGVGLIGCPVDQDDPARPKAGGYKGPEICGLRAGGEWIRTFSSAILIMLRRPAFLRRISGRLSKELDRFQRTPRSSRPPVDSNSVTSGLAGFDPVLRAPLPQSRLLGLVREIVPPFEGAPPHQQLLISAVSTSSAEDVANFVVVVG